MKHIFIINPAAGKTDIHMELTKQINTYFAEHKGDYEILLTEYAGHAVKLAEQCCKGNDYCRIYAVGGDGTLNEVAQGAYKYDNCEIGIYPTGTGNDFIKSFDVEKERYKDIGALVNGNAVKCDLIKVNDRISINVSSIGFDSEVARNVTRFKKLFSGNLPYTLSIAYCFLMKTKCALTITVDDETPITGDFLFAVAANGRYYGGGYNPAPLAKTDDGLLDIVLIKAVSRPTILKLVEKYKKGTHLERTDIVTYKKAKKMTVEADRIIYNNIDGEVEATNKAEFEILPDSIKFILPSNINIE